MSFKKALILLLLVAIFTLSGCNSKNVDTREIVAVSIVPQATFAEKICGEKYNIITMIPSGASPETYEPTPTEIARLSHAKLYFAIGVPAEETSVLPLISDETQIISLEKYVSTLYPDRIEDGGRDPHIWLSPKRVIAIVEKMSEEFCKLDPDNKSLYNENANNYINELKALDTEIAEMADKSNSRDFLVFHPSFGYFADDYGLTMHALEDHGKEATAKQLAVMADFAKQKKIDRIFYQAESSGKQAKAFAEEIGGKAIELEPLSPDYIENMKKLATQIFKAVK